MNFFAALTCTIFAWGLAEGHKVFFEKFSECRSQLPQNTQNSQNLLLDILPQIADADVGGYDILATPTQPLTSRGCSCLSCTNKADGIHVLGWCT